MKKLLFLFFTILCFQGYSQGSNLSELKGKEIHSKIRLNYISVDMPFNQFTPNLEKKMSMLGMHYHLPFSKHFYGGVGMYGAIFGDQSGFFTIGATLGYKTPLLNNFSLDANFHFGGGGSNSQLVNTGLLINPNIGIQYNFNKYSIGVQYSHVDFPTGIIKSNTWSIYLEIPSILKTVNNKYAHQEFSLKNLDKDSFWNTSATKSVQQVRFDFLFPIGDSKKDNNQKLDETLYMLGFEYQKFLSKNTFAYIHTDAIYKGLTAGYMDLFFGVGHNWVNNSTLNLFTKIGIGAAGGRVAQEGGLTAYPSAGFDYKISKNIALSGHLGYFRFLDGTLEAYTTGLGIKYINYTGGSKDLDNNKFNSAKTRTIQLALENQWYWNMNRRDGSIVDLDQLAIRIIFNSNKNIYFIGETSFAYGGADAGGYAHGIIGFGYNTNNFFNNKFSSFLELGAGVAGGGKIDTEGGIVLRPTVGLNYHFNDELNLKASYGQLFSASGSVNSPNVNLGLVYQLSFLQAKK